MIASKIPGRVLIVTLVVGVTGLSPSKASDGYRRSGTTEQLAPVCSESGEYLPDVSPNGRYVAFVGPRGLSGSGGNHCDVYVADRRKGVIELISKTSDGAPALTLPTSATISRQPSISATGRYVAFTSNAINLVPNDLTPEDDILVYDRKNGEMTLVSVSEPPLGLLELPTGFRGSIAPSISGSGQFIAFMSDDPFLEGNEADMLSPPRFNVYLRDMKDQTTFWVTHGNTRPTSYNTLCGADPFQIPSISMDGKHVTFPTALTLSPDDTDIAQDTYTYDVAADEYQRVSVATDGSQVVGNPGRACVAAHTSGPRRISANGDIVIFQHNEGGLVPNDTNAEGGSGALNGLDVFVRDLESNRVERISVSSTGGQSNSASFHAAISPDGRYVTFTSWARNLIEEETHGDLDPTVSDPDVFVYDRKTGALELISVASDRGDQSSDKDCFDGAGLSMSGSISDQGLVVAFISCADNLVNTTTGAFDLFVRDRGRSLGSGIRPSERIDTVEIEDYPLFEESGIVEISDSASDTRSPLSSGWTELTESRVVHRPALDDLYVTLELAHMPRTPLLAAATAGVVYGLEFTINSQRFEVRAASTGLDSNGGTSARIVLLRCGDSRERGRCAFKAAIEGSFATTGERITFALPLEELSISGSPLLSQLRAFTGLGSIVGPYELLDEIEFAGNR